MPDRFTVGLAVLSLLSEVAGERPLICVVDDVQWLDLASSQALAFTARHLAAAPVAVVLGVRSPGAGQALAGLAELVVGGLAEGDARALLEAAIVGPLDERVRDRIVAEAGGNPRALLELAFGVTPGNSRAGSGCPAPSSCPPGSRTTSGGSWHRFRRRRASCFWSPRPSRLVTRCCCGGQRTGWA